MRRCGDGRPVRSRDCRPGSSGQRRPAAFVRPVAGARTRDALSSAGKYLSVFSRRRRSRAPRGRAGPRLHVGSPDDERARAPDHGERLRGSRHRRSRPRRESQPVLRAISPPAPRFARTSSRRSTSCATTNSSTASRIVVIGHSMGAGAVLDYATHDPNLSGAVMISGGWSLGPERPKNALFIFAENDPKDAIQDTSTALAAHLAGVPIKSSSDKLYGGFAGERRGRSAAQSRASIISGSSIRRRLRPRSSDGSTAPLAPTAPAISGWPTRGWALR